MSSDASIRPEPSPAPGTVDDACAVIAERVDFLQAADLRDAADPAALLETLTVLQRRLDAIALEAVRVFDSSQAWKADGAASAGAWLRANLRMTPGAARQAVRTARRIGDVPVMRQALADGAISREHVQVVTGAIARTPQRATTIAAAEPTFTAAAREVDPAQLARVVTRWTHAVDPLGAVENEQAIHAARYLSISRTFDGAVKLDALLGPEQGAVVMNALEAVATGDYRDERTTRLAANGTDRGSVSDRASALARGLNAYPSHPAQTGVRSTPDDERTPGQRRADALVALSHRFLDAGISGEIAGVRPHVQLTVPLSTLTAQAGEVGHQPGELDGIGPVSGSAARRVGCDALIAVMGLDPLGAPLTYGRSQRTVDPRLRKVLNHRDGGCRFPGCDRPTAWCQAHHLVHWAEGGSTDPANLALLCSHHHHCVHEGGFTTRGSPADGTLTFHRPDGTPLPDRGRRPPPVSGGT